MTEMDGLWNVYFSINDTQLVELNGVKLPLNYTIKMRHWTHNKYIPELTDPFNPFHTTSSIKEFTVPLPKTRPCQFGKAFYDMESGVEKIYIGVSNSTEMSDNVGPFHLAHELCHSCELPCDHYKCSEECDPSLDDGYQILTVQMANLTLEPGDAENEEEIFRNVDDVAGFSDNNVQVSNDTAFISNRYFVLVKVINEAGLERIVSSPGTGIYL